MPGYLISDGTVIGKYFLIESPIPEITGGLTVNAAVSPVTVITVTGGEDFKGDVNRDGSVNLTDAVIALQVAVGIRPSYPVFDVADVDGDEKIGLEEAIYILNEVSKQYKKKILK